MRNIVFKDAALPECKCATCRNLGNSSFLLIQMSSACSMVQQSGQNNGNFWEKSLKPMEELTTSDLTPLPEPERSLRAAIAKMVEANNADRKQLDWQVRPDSLICVCVALNESQWKGWFFWHLLSSAVHYVLC